MVEQLSAFWDRIERQAIYGVLLLFFALQFLALFVPVINDFMDAQGSLILITLVLIFIFRYLDERLDNYSANDVALTHGFTEGVHGELEPGKQYDSIDVFAYTGTKYYHALHESGARVKKLRLLLRDVDKPDTLQFPSQDDARRRIAAEVEQMTTSWGMLQASGMIEELTVKYYSFDPTYHFMIINGKTLHFGLFEPKPGFAGAEILTSYIVKGNTLRAKHLLSDFDKQFEVVWNQFAHPAQTPPP